LTEGRALLLGGVEIPHSVGLLGHSDADVLTHSIMDALLGAAALGDIGQMFPDSDPAYSGANSIKLLEQVRVRLAENGYRVSCIDSTLIAQKPKLAPFVTAMRENLAKALDLSVSCVNVKATTEEGLGFSGKEEGIAAHAVCLLETL